MVRQILPADVERDIRMLHLLAKRFPSVENASAEIINLEAILNLPKGTEHFVADIHGEHEAFLHILRNASGNIKRKTREIFADTLSEEDIADLCTLIYYPEQKLEMIISSGLDNEAFYAQTLLRLVRVCQSVASKYTRSKVRKVLPAQFAYIIEELLHENPFDDDKDAYFRKIIETIIQTNQQNNFVIAICQVIHTLSIDQLHILGDVYDRGPGAHIIMDYLMQRKHFDVQWGNHDCLWMGAAAGNNCCIATVLRLSLRFANMATLEDGYGINLLPLATFAMDTYANDPCTQFLPQTQQDNPRTQRDTLLLARMHKAITVIQFKLEAQIRQQHPEWALKNRGTFNNIDFDGGYYIWEGKHYPLVDYHFPTVSPQDPFSLSTEEQDLIEKLHHSFCVSEKLQRHIARLLQKGSMYKVCNGNLLFHASVPLNSDGTLRKVALPGGSFAGRELMDRIAQIMRSAFQRDVSNAERLYARDFFWYLWCGADSPLFDKDRMTTFERYFLFDKKMHAEQKGYYFQYRDNPQVCDNILDAFGVKGSYRHIINGHVPVHVAQGENPSKAGGRLMVIDGGFSRAYHRTTGIAGYTLVYHSRGFQLIQHEPFTSTQEAINKGLDIQSSTQIVEMTGHRMRVRDTDKGKEIEAQIHDLHQLIYAYRHGLIREERE